jgi:TolB-like protein/Tfp pilus assembly protein PilF
MAEERVQRRLAAILAADVVGYSRLMERDETGTLAILKARRKDVLEPLVARHQGRVFKVTGDGVLVQFGSAVDAVQCAIDLQQAMAASSEDLPDDNRIVLRIGINLGDVILEGSDLYGDGVNIAARLEAMAEPGGILVSGAAYDQVKNKVGAGFDDLGVQSLKNIQERVRVYRITGTPRVSTTAPDLVSGESSIAVLPFVNMSGDPGQQYFSDGITEDIITELSRFRQLRVVARNSSFRYRGEDVDVVRVGRELDVQYLVEGSVRRLGDRVRVTAQLIDAVSGHHLWAERFDRKQEELFDVQDQVVRTIASTLMGRLNAARLERAKRKPPGSLAAYECLLRGDALPFDDPESDAEARRMFEKAIELDPGYAKAHAALANALCRDWFRDSGSDHALEQAYDVAKKAVALDNNESVCHAALGWVHLLRHSYDLAEHHFLKSVELNPNSAIRVASLGNPCTTMGRPEEAIAYLKEAKRLDPFFDPTWYWPTLGVAYFVARRYDEAIASLSRSQAMPVWVQAYLAACYAHKGDMNQARHHAAEVVQRKPDFSLVGCVAKESFKLSADREHLAEGLRKAGLPE